MATPLFALISLLVLANPQDNLAERSLVAAAGWSAFVPIESAPLDRVEADIHPSGKGAIAAASHGRYGGSSLWLVLENGEVRELLRTGESQSLSKPVWSKDGARFAVVLQQAPRWIESAGGPMLQFQGSLVVGAPDGSLTQVPGLADAARVLTFSGREVVATRYLAGDLPEERPFKVDLRTGAATPLLSSPGHVYGVTAQGERLYFARATRMIVTLPAPEDVVEVVESDLAGRERVLATETGALPSEFALVSGALRWESEGSQTRAQVDLASGKLDRWGREVTLTPDGPLFAPGQYLAMPYIHQVYDTPNAFNGNWACGPTSTLMAVLHFNRLQPWPCTVSVPTSHTSPYGRYDSDTYTAFGSTFNRVQNDASGHAATGAYGWCTDGGGAWAYRMQDYAKRHSLSSDFDGTATFAKLQANIDAGKVVPLSTQLTSAGHIVVVKGYTAGGLVVVNDPYGNKNSGYMNYKGETVAYTWATMSPKWFINVYGTVTPTVPDYQATWIAQSYPATMVGGTQAAASITYRNDGAQTWNAQTRLGTTVARDRASVFYTAGNWISAGRLAASAATAKGAQNKFSFTLSAPDVCTPTTWTEHFNLVQEAKAWFSDTGQGGPKDDAVWFKITVNPAPGACQDAGAPAGPDAATPPGEDAGAVPPGEDAGAVPPGDDASVEAADGGEVVVVPDAGAIARTDAGAIALGDGGGKKGNAEVVTGCGCAAGGAAPLAGLALLALGTLRRRR